MEAFLTNWHKAAMTTLGFFWMALWAFILGYIISSMIQVFVTKQRMKEAMGETGPKSVALGTFFGFISSSCSFAALATTKSLFKKGAGLVPSLAFMLASTNLVIELGMVIAVFMSWQFVVGEYVGGLLLIAFMWVLVKLTKPKDMVESAREELADDDDDSGSNNQDWKDKITSLSGLATSRQTIRDGMGHGVERCDCGVYGGRYYCRLCTARVFPSLICRVR
ncbi:MAG: permease [Vampirovibrionales bacterium]